MTYRLEAIEPPGWPRPSGYANGVLVTGAGRLLFVAGQIAWDAERNLVGPGDLVAQLRQALANVVAVLRAAGGGPEHLARVTLYVTDKRLYLARLRDVGETWRAVVGRHYPAMALVEVAALLEEGALVEVEATAALP